MSRIACVALAVGAAVWVPRSGGAQETEPGPRYDLTLKSALDRARKRSTAIRVAHARVGEARGQLLTATPLLRDTPTLELAGGPRVGPAGVAPEVGIHIGQVFELGGQRDARIAAAEAEIERAKHGVAETRWRVLAAVARTFLEARRADELLRVAEAADRLAQDLHRVAARRHKAGDVGAIDEELTALTMARTRAEVRGALARRDRATGALRVLLALEPAASVSVGGKLFQPGTYAFDQLLAQALERPDLRALDARARASDAAAALGESEAWPDLEVKVGYVREEQANVIVGGLSVTLPAFERGQGLKALARAQQATLRIERTSLQLRLRTEVRTALDAYRVLASAVREFEERGTPRMQAAQALTRQSYQAGELPLGELLVRLRELVAARKTHIELLFEAALAKVELETVAGIL